METPTQSLPTRTLPVPTSSERNLIPLSPARVDEARSPIVLLARPTNTVGINASTTRRIKRTPERTPNAIGTKQRGNVSGKKKRNELSDSSSDEDAYLIEDAFAINDVLKVCEKVEKVDIEEAYERVPFGEDLSTKDEEMKESDDAEKKPPAKRNINEVQEVKRESNTAKRAWPTEDGEEVTHPDDVSTTDLTMDEMVYRHILDNGFYDDDPEPINPQVIALSQGLSPEEARGSSFSI